MTTKKRSRKKSKKTRHIPFALFAFVVFISASGLGVYHLVNANTKADAISIPIDPNIGIKARVENFFNANDATEMISIIKCESEFKHYNPDGTVLKNKAGSSATGIAQILTSTHPDPKVLSLYNKLFNTELAVEDFNIETIEGNLGYALMLYELRGTKDWECSKKFRFN